MILLKKSPEFIFVGYFWSFIYLKLVYLTDEKNSWTYLFISLTFFLSLYTINLFKNRIKNNYGLLIYPLFIFIEILLDLVLRPNDLIYSNLYIFGYNCIIPILFLTQLTDYTKAIKYYCYLSLIGVILFALDPIRDIPMLGDYMGYGYGLAVPAFLGCYIGFRYFKKKFFLIAWIFELACIIVFANRGAIISVGAIIFCVELLIGKNKKKICVFSILLIIAIISLVNPLFNFFIFISDKLGYSSYALSGYNEILKIGFDGINYSGRDILWTTTMDLVSNNIMFGKGIGYFQTKTGYYPHNYFFDLLSNGGAILALIHIIWLYATIKKVILSNSKSLSFRLFSLMLLLLAFPKLFLSLTYVVDFAYACFMSLLFIKSKNENSYR